MQAEPLSEPHLPQRSASWRPSPMGLRWTGALLGLCILILGWLLPPQFGLSTEAQRAFSLILFTIAWCAFSVVPEGLSALFFILAVVSSGLAPAEELLLGWTDPVMWFNVAAFGIGFAFQRTGLGERLALMLLIRTGVRFPTLVAVIFAINILFSVGGLSSVARLAILLPVLASLASMCGLEPGDRGYRGLLIAAVSASTLSGLFLLTGTGLNPAAILFAGTTILYGEWLAMFTPVVAIMTAGMAVAIGWAWRPDQPIRTHREGQLVHRFRKLGRLSPSERRVLIVMAIAFILWNLDFLHGINPGWIALFAATLLASPSIGVMSFDECMRSCNWNVIFFISAMLGIGHLLAYTGLGEWMAERLWSVPLPSAAFGLFLGLGVLAILIHIPSGSSLASMSIMIPAMAAYGARLGFRPEVIGFFVHSLLWSQFFFPYQHISPLFVSGHDGFRSGDLILYGVLSGVVLLGSMCLFGLPYWSALGVLHR